MPRMSTRRKLRKVSRNLKKWFPTITKIDPMQDTEPQNIKTYCTYLIETKTTAEDIDSFIRSELPAVTDPPKHSDYMLIAVRKKKLNELFNLAKLSLNERLMVYTFTALQHNKGRLINLMTRLSDEVKESTVKRAIDFMRTYCCCRTSQENDLKVPLSSIPSMEPGIASLCWRDSRELAARKLDDFLALPFIRLLATDPKFQISTETNRNIKYCEGQLASGDYYVETSEAHFLRDFNPDGVLQTVFPSTGPFGCYTMDDILLWLNARRPYRVLCGRKAFYIRRSGAPKRPLLACDLPQWPCASGARRQHAK